MLAASLPVGSFRKPLEPDLPTARMRAPRGPGSGTGTASMTGKTPAVTPPTRCQVAQIREPGLPARTGLGGATHQFPDREPHSNQRRLCDGLHSATNALEILALPEGPNWRVVESCRFRETS